MINIENTDDNECFKWSIVRYLNLADRNTARIKKTDKEFAKKLDFKNINFPVKIRDHQRIKLPFKIDADFESILVPENNGKKNPKESHTNNYQKHIACSYGYKLVCVDDRFSKPFKTYLGKEAVYNKQIFHAFLFNIRNYSREYSTT